MLSGVNGCVAAVTFADYSPTVCSFDNMLIDSHYIYVVFASSRWPLKKALF
jgi:hypothetical protein